MKDLMNVKLILENNMLSGAQLIIVVTLVKITQTKPF